MRASLYQLIAFGFYPAWLLAGAFDYWCHRRSSIERTSGATEARYHLAQLATIAVIVFGIAFFEPSRAVFVIVVVTSLVHTVLSYFDVQFTERRRYISPLEQHVHAVLDIVPLAAIALWLVMEWATASSWTIQLRDPMLESSWVIAIIVSVLFVAGCPVLEELWRTQRFAAREGNSARGEASEPERFKSSSQ